MAYITEASKSEYWRETARSMGFPLEIGVIPSKQKVKW